MKPLILCCFFLAVSTALFCQPYFSKTIDLTQSSDSGWKIFALEDGLMIYTASRFEEVPRVALVKTDFEGEPQWFQIFEGYKAPTLEGAILCENDFYLTLQAPDTASVRIKVAQVDLDGALIQNWEYGAGIEGERPFGIVKYLGNIVLSNMTRVGEEDQGWILFLDEEMQPSHEVFYHEDGPYNTVIERDLLPTQDGHLLATTADGYIGFLEGLVTKLDSLGQVVWQTRLPVTGETAKPIHAVELQNGDYAVSWTKDNNDLQWVRYAPIIYGLNPQGDTIWSQVLNSLAPDARFLENLFLAGNGDIIGTGYAFPWRWAEGNPYCGWIFRLSPTGQPIWDRIICDARSPLELSWIAHGAELPNKDLVFSGVYYDTFPNYEPFVNDINIWLLRVDSNGCLIPGCADIQVVTDSGTVNVTALKEQPALLQGPFLLFPNPARDQVSLKVADADTRSGPLHFVLMNALGQPVLERRWPHFPGGHQERLDISGLPPGWYAWTIRSEDRPVQSGKLIIQTE